MLVEMMEPIARLDRDLKAAARTLGAREVRYIIDSYYQIQKFRTIASNQVRAAAGSAEPNRVTDWIFESMRRVEGNVRRAMDEFSSEFLLGQWLKSLCGIGPVISAGLLAHLDVRKAPHASHFWSFAGLNPTAVWAKGQKRPWNARLKRLCFLIGDCFVKVQGNAKDFYGKLYVDHRAREDDANARAVYEETAKASLAEKNYGKDTEARKWYEQGKLPPARMYLRSIRWVVKLFLSHVHHAMFEDFYGRAPAVPYVNVRQPELHSVVIAPPNWPFRGDGKPLTELFGRADQAD